MQQTNQAEEDEGMPPPWRAYVHQALMLTLYERPPDWPRHCVIRALYIGQTRLEVRASTRCTIHRTEAEAVKWIKRHYPLLTFQGKCLDEEPKILGVWL